MRKWSSCLKNKVLPIKANFYWDNDVGNLSQLIAGLVEGLYRVLDSVGKGHNKESVATHIKKNAYVQARLKRLLTAINASRIGIRQYHNGGYFYTGLPLQKYSCTYEVTAEGISSDMGNNQNRLLSEYPTLHSSLSNQNEYYEKHVGNIDDEALKQKLKHRGVKSFFAIGIWSIQCNLIGFMTVDWNFEEHEITTTEREALQNFAQLVAGYLCGSTPSFTKGTAFSLIFFLLTAILVVSQVAFIISSVYNLIKMWLH